MNIHLVALFYTEDVKKYVFHPNLEPLINDMKTLEGRGLGLLFSTDLACGIIHQVTGDDLRMHAIQGFTESFSSRYSCHFCLIEKDDAHTV